MLKSIFKKIKGQENVGYTKKVIIPIRFSVLQKTKAWKLSRNNDFEAYKSKLFNSDRMEPRFSLFEKLVLPSLKNICESTLDVEVLPLVIISDEMPPEYQQRFSKILEAFPMVAVKSISPETNLKDPINEFIREKAIGLSQSCVYATVRHDDDDQLSPSFIKRLKKYLTPEFASYVVTFPKGYECLYNEESDTITECIKISWPKIAIGLAHINYFDVSTKSLSDPALNVYGIGNHAEIDSKRTMIVDHNSPMYLKLSYKEQDTGGAGMPKRKAQQSSSTVELNKVAEEFPTAGNVISIASLAE